MTAIVKLLKNTRTRRQWSDAISAHWQRTAECFFATGQELIEAKVELEHGLFIAMIENDLPFKARTAQRLMAIAADQRLSNATHVSHLPPSWGTIYELTKLSDAKLEKGFASGVINPKMERKEVAILLGKPPRKKASKPKAIDFDTAIDPVDLCTMEVRAMIFATLQEIPLQRRAELFERVLGDLDDLKMKQGL